MNHQYYSVNVSNLNIEKKETTSSQTNILEKELKEIYNIQYNDLFPKIFTKTKSEFIPLLKSQVSLHLKIINKTVQTSLNTEYLENFTKKFFADKSKITKGLEDILKNPDLQKNNLQLVNCYIHCHKCSKILHECKNKLISYQSYIYCIHCQKVYNENQIKLYCEECKTCYYSKMRFVLNKKFENFYQVYFKDYHCNLEEPEKIKCLECGHDLYYNISYDKNNLKKNAISEIFCLKCKLLYDLNEVFFKCKKCKKNFKSEAKIFNNFSNLKLQFLLIMHTLRKKKLALPEKRISRKCKCDITKYEKYLHEEDKGILYLGHNLKGEYIIICDNCYSIFNYNDFIWTCPVCNINFKSKKNLYKKKYVQTMNYFVEKISPKIQKSPTMYKTPSNVNIIHRKKLIEMGPSSAENKENIVKNLFNKNNKQIQSEQKSSRNSNKFNHITKVILLTTNKKIKINNNLNISDEKIQKMHLFKKIKNISLKNNNNINYHTTINEPKKETEKKKTNLKSFIKNKNYTNNNTINSILNSISLTNNKSDCNTNKCNDSTNITSPNYENINEANNNNENNKGLNYIIEHDSNSKKNNNNKVNRKLIYNDLIEINKKPETIFDKDQIKKNIEPLREKFINAQLKQTNEINNKDIKEKILCKTSKKEKHFIKYNFVRKENKNKENLEIKKVNISSINELNNKKDTNLDSIDKSYIKKNDKHILNKTNENIDVKINNKDNKYKNIRSMKNIRINDNNLNIKNLKTSNHIKPYINLENKSNRQPIKTAQNSQNKIKLIKHIRNIRDKTKVNNNLEKNNKINISENDNKNKQLITNKEKKQISKCPTQFKLRTKKNNNSKNNQNSIFKKIKEYYDEGINEENIDSNEQKKSKKGKDINLNKSIALISKKKIKYKPFFNSEHYSILKLLGKGTYGKTYLVEDPKTKERFALKKITINDKLELKENQEEYNLILKLTKEFPELKIVNIYGIEIKTLDKYNVVMYVLMEAAKCDWEKEITRYSEIGHYYKEEHLKNILYNLVKSFAILQKKGICHRDVKPQNILCFEDNEYKISDFGEAKNFKKNMINSNKRYNNMKFNAEDNTMEQTLRGTELYMSPILFQALRARSYQFVTYNSYKSDVFSLGMCFFLASSLSYEGLYEVREIIRNKEKTRLVVNRYLSMKYSQKYINVLISMLQINEKDRPDFIELEKIIDNLNK